MWPRGESAVVGRDEELAFLAGELDRRSPSAVLLAGEPGIGKTTVWQAAIEQARQSGRIVLACRGSGAEVGDAQGRGALLYARALVTGHLGRRCGEFHSSATRNVSPGPASSVSHLASSDSTVVDLPTRPVRRQHFRSVHRWIKLAEGAMPGPA
jgi:DNA polymerase III delta prime subunit